MRIKCVMAILLGIVIVLSGCQSGEKTFRSLEEIKASGVLVVNVVGNDGYYVSDDGADFTGVEIELARKTAEALGVLPDFKRGFDVTGFTTAQVDLALGAIDPAFNGLKVAASKQTGTESAFYVSRYGESYNSVESLTDKKLGYIMGGVYANFVTGKSAESVTTTFVECVGENEMVEKLLKGEIDAFICTEIQLDELLLRYDGKIVACSAADISKYSFAIIAMTGNTALINVVNTVIDEQRAALE